MSLHRALLNFYGVANTITIVAIMLANAASGSVAAQELAAPLAPATSPVGSTSHHRTAQANAETTTTPAVPAPVRTRRSRSSAPPAPPPASLSEAGTRAACMPDISGKAGQTGTIARIEKTGDIALVDGRVLVPAQTFRAPGSPDIDWPESQTLITFVAVGNGPDRWGRQPARIVTHAPDLSGDAMPKAFWLEEEWLKRGLALTRPDGSDATCLRLLFQSEVEARHGKRGLWLAPNAIGLADQPAMLASRAGNYVIIEGVVVSVGERSTRTYLNFGTSWNEDTTVSIAKSIWTELKSRGISRQALEKRRIRARGLLELRGGPFIALLHADDIEMAGDK